MNPLTRFGSWLFGPAVEERGSNDPYLSMSDWYSMFNSFNFQGLNYTLPGEKQEEIGSGYRSTAQLAYKANGVVFAVTLVRMLLFSEARFAYQRMRGGRAGDLWSPGPGSALLKELKLLETPWPNGTTRALLKRMRLDADLAGNAFVVRRNNRLRVLRPDWVTIIGGVEGDEDATLWHPDAEVLGYAFYDGGPGLGKRPVIFDVSEVAHFAPIPDPDASFRGMSWLTPIVREVMADKAMTSHKLAFFENGATPNLSIKIDTDDLDVYKQWIREFKSEHDGADNAYKTMFLASGADATVIGTDLRQLDFKDVVAGGEARIAAAAGVPPIIAGLVPGLDSATYSNYAQAMRRLADGTLRPDWGDVSGALASIIVVPSDSRLWYDDRDIAFLKDDEKDAADSFAVDAQSYRTLVDGGVDPDSAKAAVAARDITLANHSGLLSVQLQEPGSAPVKPGNPAPAKSGSNSSRAIDASRVVEDLIASLPLPTEG